MRGVFVSHSKGPRKWTLLLNLVQLIFTVLFHIIICTSTATAPQRSASVIIIIVELGALYAAEWIKGKALMHFSIVYSFSKLDPVIDS